MQCKFLQQPERTAVDGPADSTEDNGGFYSGVATRNAPSRMRPSSTSLGFASTPNYMPIQAFRSDRQSDYVIVNLIRKPNGFGFRLLGGTEVIVTFEFSLKFLKLIIEIIIVSYYSLIRYAKRGLYSGFFFLKKSVSLRNIVYLYEWCI